MKQTVYISVYNRLSSSIFRTTFDSACSEAGQLLAFLESKKLDTKIFTLHKSFQFNPTKKFWFPLFELFESEQTLESLYSEVENAKS